MDRRGIASLVIAVLAAFNVHAESARDADVPGRTDSTNQPFGFRVKGATPTVVKGFPNLTPVLSLLPVDAHKRPTLAGLSTIAVTFDNSFTFTSNIDAHGKFKGQFKGVLLGDGHLAVQISNFDVIRILMINTQTDGVFQSPPIPIQLVITDAQGNSTLLLNKPDLTITYKVKHGTAVATAAH